MSMITRSTAKKSFDPTASSTPSRRNTLTRTSSTSNHSIDTDNTDEESDKNCTIIKTEIKTDHIRPVETNTLYRINPKMADQTIIETAASTGTVTVPKFLSPPVFDPSKDDAINFMRTFERCAASNMWANTHKLRYFESFLSGAARLWCEKYAADPINANKKWSDLSAEFLRKYAGSKAKITIRKQWNARRQSSTESLKKYYYDLIELASELDEAMSFETFMNHFEEGLTEQMWEKFTRVGTEPSNQDELEQAVHKTQALLDRRERSRVVNDIAMLTLQNNTRPYQNSNHNGANPTFRGNNNWEQSHSRNGTSYPRRGFSNSNGRGRGYQRSNGFRRGSPHFLNTRTADARVKCHFCGKEGHYAVVCGAMNEKMEQFRLLQNNQTSANPNGMRRSETPRSS